MTEGGSGHRSLPAVPDAWETSPADDPAEMSLSDVIRGVVMQPSRIEDEEAGPIAVRVANTGFRGIMRQLARELRISYSGLMRQAVHHGMGILDAHPSIVALRQAYDLTNSAAMSSGDQDALTRLNQIAAYDFKHPQSFRTTLTVSRETAARVADLAIVCGIPTPRLAVLTVLVSVLTLPNNRGYRDALLDEIEAFHRFVLYRRRVLLLGEGPGSGTGARRRLR